MTIETRFYDKKTDDLIGEIRGNFPLKRGEQIWIDGVRTSERFYSGDYEVVEISRMVHTSDDDPKVTVAATHYYLRPVKEKVKRK